MTLPNRDPPFTVWRGEYPFGVDDSFFLRTVAVGQTYADKEPGQRPSEARFREEFEALRGTRHRRPRDYLANLSTDGRIPTARRLSTC
jgi:hypothetical protein